MLISYFVYKVLPHWVRSADGTQRTVFYNSSALMALHGSETPWYHPLLWIFLQHSPPPAWIWNDSIFSLPVLLCHEWIPVISHYVVILSVLLLPPMFVTGFWRANFLLRRWEGLIPHSFHRGVSSPHTQCNLSSRAVDWNTDSLTTTIGRLQQKLPPSIIQK